LAAIPGSERNGVAVVVEYRLVADDRERLILVRSVG
jgi:hypothetical protein